MLETFIFSTFSGALLLAAVMVTSATETIHRALWLVFAFINAAALWMLLHAEFLSLTLILVYVGAVLTLFLFVIMTLSKSFDSNNSDKKYFTQYGIALILVTLIIGCIACGLYDQVAKFRIQSRSPQIAAFQNNENNTQALGIALYTHYVYPFELAGMLLLIAIIVSISLHRHSQHPPHLPHNTTLTQSNQTSVRRKDRVRLVAGN